MKRERKDGSRKKRRASDEEATAVNKDIGTARAEARGGRMTRTNSSRTIKTNDPVASTSSSLGLSPRPGLTAG